MNNIIWHPFCTSLGHGVNCVLYILEGSLGEWQMIGNIGNLVDGSNNIYRGFLLMFYRCNTKVIRMAENINWVMRLW